MAIDAPSPIVGLLASVPGATPRHVNGLRLESICLCWQCEHEERMMDGKTIGYHEKD